MPSPGGGLTRDLPQAPEPFFAALLGRDGDAEVRPDVRAHATDFSAINLCRGRGGQTATIPTALDRFGRRRQDDELSRSICGPTYSGTKHHPLSGSGRPDHERCGDAKRHDGQSDSLLLGRAAAPGGFRATCAPLAHPYPAVPGVCRQPTNLRTGDTV